MTNEDRHVSSPTHTETDKITFATVNAGTICPELDNLATSTHPNEDDERVSLMKRCEQQCFGRLLSLENYLCMFQEIVGSNMKNQFLDQPQKRFKSSATAENGSANVDERSMVEFDFSKVGERRQHIKVAVSGPDSIEHVIVDPIKNVDELVHLYKLECNQREHFFKSKRHIDRLNNFSVGIMTKNDTFDESALTFLPPPQKESKLSVSNNKSGLPPAALTTTQDKPDHSVASSAGPAKEKKVDNEFLPEISRKRRKKHFIGSDGSYLLESDTDCVRFRYYCDFILKAIPKVQRYRNSVRVNLANTKRKLANNFNKYKRRFLTLSKKNERDFHGRAKKVFKEVCNYGKRKAKSVHSNRKKKEQEAADIQKQKIQYKEMKRQQRKLNYLITQTELFSHFMGLKNPQDSSTFDINNDELAKILNILDEGETGSDLPNETTTVETANDNDQYDVKQAKTDAMESIRKAVEKQNLRLSQYQNNNVNTGNVISTDEYFQKSDTIFNGNLKGYQLKGVSWLSTLYDKGFNGILADEMGLGKTVQTMSFLAYLAETRNLWGPFLIISPSSTLHNWQQEFTKFVPEFNVLPYWGAANERKLLRSFWNSKKKFLQSRHDAPFHVLITSYQLIVRDVQFFTKLNWQYMVLDEAQAIKSSNSQRWQKLLGFKCRNRLLLTGTPMQNTMAELWSLLHFIMPVLFDSHEEFNEWFSKDIEGRVENKAAVDETHLSRLHMVLQPFMLRRTKKEVEKELTDKVEILVNCGLSLRQKFLYQIIKEKLSSNDIMDAMVDRKIGSSNRTAMLDSYKKLMNLMVQFRKVCNHPDLFESRDVNSPLYVPPIECALPNSFLDRQTLFHKPSPSITKLFDVFSADNVVRQFFHSDSNFGATYFSRVSPDELVKCHSSLLYRLQYYLHQLCVYQSQLYMDESTAAFGVETTPNSLQRSSNAMMNLIIWPRFKLSAIKLCSAYSAVLSRLAIIRNDTNIHSCGIVKINPRCTFSNVNSGELDSQQHYTVDSTYNQNQITEQFNKIYTLESTGQDSLQTYPNIILSAFCKKVTTSPPKIKIISKRAAVHLANLNRVNKRMERFLVNGCCQTLIPNNVPSTHSHHWSYNSKMGYGAICPPQGWSNVIKSDPSELIVDSDKMLVLHSLLSRLKSQGHRVLIYSQMTRMIDILENYLIQVKHKYVRLDGSSKMADRRETVSDFQTNTDIFVFLLSTRAGGVGINLTAADTVIFYDSDWNPTVDQQAMDRAHRLGQTRQVTVYRLICVGTVEERILQKANQKSIVQQMIISGKDKNKSLKPKEIVALLLDEDELQQRMKARRENASTDRRKNKPVAKKTPTIKSLTTPKKNRKRNNPAASQQDQNTPNPKKIKLD